MCRYIISIILLLGLFIPPVSCCSQDKLQESWDSGHEHGFQEGWNEGWDAAFQVMGKGIAQTATTSRNYVGSINSNIYHYPHCKWAKEINPENEIWFSSPQDAKSKGYRPCRDCDPP